MSSKKKLVIGLCVTVLTIALMLTIYFIFIVNPTKKEISNISMSFLDILKFDIKDTYLDHNKMLSKENQEKALLDFKKNIGQIVDSNSYDYDIVIRNYSDYMKMFSSTSYPYNKIEIKDFNVVSFNLKGDSAEIEIDYNTVYDNGEKYESSIFISFKKQANKWKIVEWQDIPNV